jgi:pimeloyl-ACP methyl ester carboxylesterase
LTILPGPPIPRGEGPGDRGGAHGGARFGPLDLEELRLLREQLLREHKPEPEPEPVSEYGEPTEDDFATMHRAYTEVAPNPDQFFPFLEKIQPAVHAFEPWNDEQLARLTMPILMIIGDTDFVRLEHAVEMQNRLPDSQLAILPGTKHTEVIARADLVLPMVTAFLHD